MSMFDMMGMMGKVKEMQAKMQEAQGKLSEITAEGDAGGGMINVVVNGKKELLSIAIEPELLNSNEAKMLQDLIVAAVNKALTSADSLAKAEIAKATEGVIPNIPGLNLDSFFNR